MNLKESILNLKYIQRVVKLLDNIYEHAEYLEKKQLAHNQSLDNVYFKKIWEIQIKRFKEELLKEPILSYTPKSFPEKIYNIFKKKKEKEIIQVSKFEKLKEFDNFCQKLNEKNSFVNPNKLDLNETEPTFEDMAFITPLSFIPSFDERVDLLISDLTKYPSYSKRYLFNEQDIPLLEELKTSYKIDCEDSVKIDCEMDFKVHMQNELNDFINDVGSIRQHTLFNTPSYHPEALVKHFYINLKHTDLIKEIVEKEKVIYRFFLEVYRKEFDAHNKLTYYGLMDSHQSLDELLTGIEDFLIFEECNVLHDLNYLFPAYNNTHNILKEILIELKERNLIPDNIEKAMIQEDSDFGRFFKTLVERFDLNKQLNTQLSDKPKSDVKIKVNKI